MLIVIKLVYILYIVAVIIRIDFKHVLKRFKTFYSGCGYIVLLCNNKRFKDVF